MQDSSSKSTRVGRVVGLWRYPVKSMAPEALTEIEVSWHGLAGDRRWAFIRDGVAKSGFPWLTLRQRADMRDYHPSFSDPAKPDTSKTMVKTPSGASFEVTDPVLAAELGAGARVIKQDRGVFDSFPLSLITTQSIHHIGETVGVELDPLRFRPNLLVETIDGTPFAEDSWVGRELTIGELRMRVDKRDGRCVVITQDPQTHESNPEILRAVAQDRQGCLGVYGSIAKPGRVAVGDPVSVHGGE